MADGGKKLKYPKAVFFIISNEFCERFAFYGMRTALSLYFVDILQYTDTTATVLYHAFTMLAYFFPLLGAVIADSWLGKFRTILYLSIVYAGGQLLLSISSVPALNLPVREISLLGLVLIALGTGGIKPCVSAFGGDQFKMPEQEAYLSSFFSFFYLSINAGSLFSTFITPILRKDVTCFRQNTCYPLAFLVPCLLMTGSIVIFFAGKRMYKIKEPQGNVVLKVTKCIAHAISRKMKSKEKREHWLDHADDEYDGRTIEDVKSVLKVLKLFVPLPVFWALFDQQGSRWTFQATRMDGEVFGYLLKPDQFQVANPLLIIIFIPIFQWCIYPIIEKFLYIRTPLRKLTVGGCLAGVAFIISALVELSLEPTYVVQPENGLAQVRIFNTINCKASIFINEQQYDLEAMGMYQNISIPAKGDMPLSFSATYKNCQYINSPITGILQVKEAESISWSLSPSGLSAPYPEILEKSKSGDPKVRALIYLEAGEVITDKNATLFLDGGQNSYKLNVTRQLGFGDFVEVTHNSYKILLDNKIVANDMLIKYGGVYTIVGYATKDNKVDIKSVVVAEPNSVHMFWLLPQYIVMTMGEVMFSITGVEYAFTQAPVSMKSLLQAVWLLTVAFGNLIVVIIAEAQFFKRQLFEFVLFAVLMFLDMIIFSVMAKYYKYVEIASSDNSANYDEINLKPKEGISNASYSEDL